MQRFEREAPNELWQMDFKGHMPLSGGGRCHPLTVVDDHSRYNLCLAACADEQRNMLLPVVRGTERHDLGRGQIVQGKLGASDDLNFRITVLSCDFFSGDS